MLNEQQLRSIFESKYSPESWTSILRENFNASKLHKKPVDITARIKENSYKAKAFELGSMETIEGYLIGLYQVDVPSKAQLHRNRKGLRDLLSNVYSNDVDAALVVFVQEEKWRFTYVSEITTKEDGKRKKKATDPKRYTYLFGKGEKAKTAAQQFSKIKIEENLLEKGIKLQALNDFFNVDKMSKAFFDEYRQHYGKFTAYITGEDENQKKIDKASPLFKSTFNSHPKEARDFVKKMLGRIVFLYFLEKKGWLGVPVDGSWADGDVDFLSKLFKNSKDQDAFYSNVLAPLFFTALNKTRPGDIYELPNGEKVKIPFLNGGLFEEDDNKKTEYLQFPKELFSNLFNFFDRYNFTVYEDSPDEHTVAVDPEMLGHIFENLLEDNKDKGAYYTPKEIVHYMCQESLIEYLYTKINPGVKAELDTTGKAKPEVLSRGALEKYIKQTEVKEILDYEEAILTALYNVKVCDPAIGSGAFPMGVLMEIFHAVETMFDASPHVTKKVWKLKNNEWANNRAAVKQNIIQNSIYGVDIEQGAVDIARLRFWLSLVVDEEEPQPLPNLDYKIVVGDSLLSKYNDVVIDIDWNPKNVTDEKAKKLITDQQVKLHLLQQKQHLFFVSQHGDKKKLKEEIRKLKTEILINQVEITLNQYKKANPYINSFDPTPKEKLKNLEIKQQTALYLDTVEELKALFKNKGEQLQFFDWKLDFPEIMNERVSKEIGFDLIIGNPPYVQLQSNSGALAKQLLGKGYETFERTGDIYTLFYEKGYVLLKNQGYLAYITSNKWMRAGYGESLRNFFAMRTNPVLLVDFAGQKIFENVTVDTNILLFQKSPNKQHAKACIVKEKCSGFLSQYIDENSINSKFTSSQSWIILNSIEQRIKEKIEKSGTPLKEWDLTIYRGILTGFNEAFIIDGEKRQELIDKDPKSAEVIRPILRGRDITRFKYQFADLWLLNTHNGIKEKGIPPIELKAYPAIKKHLRKYYKELEKRADKGDTPYHLRNCAYTEDFFRPKLIWAETMRIHKNSSQRFPRFGIDSEGIYMTDKTCFFATGFCIKYVLAVLNSSMGRYLCSKYVSILDDGGYLMQKIFIEKIPIPKADTSAMKKMEKLIDSLLNDSIDEDAERKIDMAVYELYELSESEIKFLESNNETSLARGNMTNLIKT